MKLLAKLLSNKLWGSVATIAGGVAAIQADDPLIALVAAVIGSGAVIIEKLKDVRDAWYALEDAQGAPA